MNENSFNVCSRCGSANPLSARYCYQCGYELKSPEAPVVCTKCNTVNQGSANFCKRCGSKLPKAQSKTLCPQCSASNNASSTYCVNCGFDFTTSTMPSSVALAGRVERQPAVVATTTSVEVQPQEKKLSRKDKKRLKREEEERLYREQMAARAQAKLDKKQAKKEAKANAKAAKKQVVEQPVAQQQMMQQPVVQYPVVAQPMQQVQYLPPVVQQIVVEQPKPKAKKHRIKNLIVFLIALVGLYFILLPQQANLFKQWGLMVYTSATVPSVKLTGWDALVALLSNFAPDVASLSTIASTYTFDSIEMLITGIILGLAVLDLVFVLLSKLVGIISGKAHKGIDFNAIGAMLVSGGAFAYGYIHGVNTIAFSLYALVIPVVFLAIAIFNSKIKKD